MAALFESAGRWVGQTRRTLVFGAMARPSGPRTSFDDGWDLATRWILPGSLRLCASALIVWVTGFAPLR